MKMLERTITMLKAKESVSDGIQKDSYLQLFGKVKHKVVPVFNLLWGICTPGSHICLRITHTFGTLDIWLFYCAAASYVL